MEGMWSRERDGLKLNASVFAGIHNITSCVRVLMTDRSEQEITGESPPNKKMVPEPIDRLVGSVLEERYHILELIGTGGWGNVYRAKHLTLDMDVAIKVVHPHLLHDRLRLSRFEQEAHLLGKIESPHIVRIIDHGFAPTPFIVMEYYAGVTLSQWLQENGPMPAQTAIDLFLQLLDALRTAEALNIVHRDLKPSNILVKLRDGEVHCKILDFGIAKFVEPNTPGRELTTTGEILGSPAYMSPEQWKGLSDKRSDVYSLGCIIYELLAGKPPFAGSVGMEYMYKHVSERPPSISSLNKSVSLPAGLEDIVHKCLEKAPSSRYQSSEACINDLKRLKAGNKPSISAFEKIRRRTSKGFLIGASALFVCVFAGLEWYQDGSFRHQEKLSNALELGPGKTIPDKWKGKTVAQWSKDIEADPTNSELVYNRGVLHLIRSELGECNHDLTRAIELDPKLAEAYVQRAIVTAWVSWSSDYKKALDDVNKAISLNPRLAHAYAIRAYMYEFLEQHDLAIADCTKAISLGERGSEFEEPGLNVYCVLSKAYLNTGRFDDAFHTVDAGLKVIPSNQKWILHNHSAMIHCWKQDFEKALNDLRLATEDPNCKPDAWYWKAYCLAGMGKTSEAEEACATATQAEPVAFDIHPSYVYWRRAECYRQEGNLNKAIEECNRAISLSEGKCFFPFRLRAICHMQLGQLRNALKDLNDSCALNPCSAKSLSLLASVEYKLGEQEKAWKDISRAFALSTDTPSAYVNRGSIKFDAGMSKEALLDLDHVITLDPYSKEAYILREKTHAKLGQAGDARSDTAIAEKLVTHVELPSG